MFNYRFFALGSGFVGFFGADFLAVADGFGAGALAFTATAFAGGLAGAFAGGLPLFFAVATGLVGAGFAAGAGFAGAVLTAVAFASTFVAFFAGAGAGGVGSV